MFGERYGNWTNERKWLVKQLFTGKVIQLRVLRLESVKLIIAANHTSYITHSQHNDTRPTSPGTDPTTPAAWQGHRWSTSA